MAITIKESQHLSIPFEDIDVATEKFTTIIGKGGYGFVYKGQLLLSGKLTTVAVKRLNNVSDQGFKEFLTEIKLLSRYKHPNLISLLGFCEEGNEKILIYEYAERGSLDKYLSGKATSSPLTWSRRINISIDAARGLDYLHNHVGKSHRIIHRDIKSANILLDQSWKAKISDLGLSKIGLSNENDSYLITNACGTHGYCDPVYRETGILTKESDVYSFGVVLFEVLCGRLCFMNVPNERRFLDHLAQRYYETGRFNEIIDIELKDQIGSTSLNIIADIAYQCLQNDREKRPSMSLVVAKLEEARESHNDREKRPSMGLFVQKLEKARESQESIMPYEGGVSVYTPAPGPLDVFENKDLDGIDTHNSALNGIIAALEDESKQIIGIYGLGGVGKTTLAKEVAARVKTLFADVAFITVSQTVNVDKIKKDTENASKRIMNGDKILIILDDVWETLDLQELYIPCGSRHKNCKILLTSRRQDVCEKMNAQSICVNSLPTKEAWILFKRVAGERVETDAELKPVAEQVATECGGLPLLIQVVGSTLKNKSISSWKSALSRLKKPAPSEIDPDIRKAFTRLQLSYDYLESEEAKSCFLLCSMFPEDDIILLVELMHYMVGLHKFDDLESMEDARDRVQNAVNMLTSSCLLLNHHWVGFTKMHDVVRDVALLIASKGENKYLVKAGKGLKEWLPLPSDSGLKSTGISLMENSISKLPDYEVHLPSLDIFLVNGNHGLEMISDEFIEGMKEVKVLDMKHCKITRLPQSMKLLTKLRMLNLSGNKSLHEISILGEMRDLEILLLNSTGITKIPQEIGRLVNLRRLEVIWCNNLINVAPGVISRLQRLEELCINFSRLSEGVSDCIVEVMKLSNLTYLELWVNSIDLIPEGFNAENLKGFNIIIGEMDSLDIALRTGPIDFSKRYLHIGSHCFVIPLLKRLKKLIEISRPITFLSEIENLNNIMPTLCDEGFNKLEDIKMYRSPNVSCLVDDNTRCDGDGGKAKEKFFKELKHLELDKLNKLEVLWKCQDKYISLTNLVTLKISSCNKLERVFTVSVAQDLVNLKILKIDRCGVLEEVIWGGGGDDESGIVIVFPSLTNISLRFLDSLKRFYSGNFNTNYPSLADVEIYRCVSMKIWGPGIHETPNLKTLRVNDVQVLEDGPCAINDALEKKKASNP